MTGFILFVPYTATVCHLMDNNAFFPLQALLLWNLCWQPFSSYVGRVLSSPALVWHGELTYGIYLFQMMANLDDYPWSNNWPGTDYPMGIGGRSAVRSSFFLSAVMELVLCTVIAWALRKLVEVPVARAIRSWF
jgi:peptidoglycan/LPS O-acetylase OafA/YrhL